MASPEAKDRMLTREHRRSEAIAESIADDAQVRRFLETREQPDYGDPEMKRIFELRAFNDLLQEAYSVDIDEKEISDEGRLKKYSAEEDGMVDFVPTWRKIQPEQGQELDTSGDTSDDEPDATDAAVTRAEELGVNLSDVQGTGKDGRITVPDVESHAEDSESGANE